MVVDDGPVWPVAGDGAEGGAHVEGHLTPELLDLHAHVILGELRNGSLI